MFAIYKRELRSFFHGMMGYVLTAFLLATSGLYFLALDLGYGMTDFSYYTLYRTIFILLLYIPVLTMRSLAEERRSRTDQLLLTSPVSVWGIVLGKFFAALLIFALGSCIMLVYAVILHLLIHLPLHRKLTKFMPISSSFKHLPVLKNHCSAVIFLCSMLFCAVMQINAKRGRFPFTRISAATRLIF